MKRRRKSIFVSERREAREKCEENERERVRVCVCVCDVCVCAKEVKRVKVEI